MREIRARLNNWPRVVHARARRPRPRGRARVPPSGRCASAATHGAFGRKARRFAASGVVFVNGVPAGVVVGVPRSAFRQLGPTLALVGVRAGCAGDDRGRAADLRTGARPAAKSRRCRAQGRRRRFDGACARGRRRRSGRARARLQPDDARSAAARRSSCRRPIARDGCCWRTFRTS